MRYYSITDYVKLIPERVPNPYKEKIGVTAQVAFQHLWEFINGTESWKSNPWVWVYSFEILKNQPC
jgi:hypothetical protein